ncbi:hypothetical protein HPB52_014728 [Rhipicephalus sanguineus]|uniref:Uncharacterized protein n=1 Tax=Rhipicephalus sanguineus TaxID=34632 RepID=A0A9D4Q0E8_RHISA|nr:hypothetical protein HPB52_014728 [Rhipicephalus sanguineus]
MVEFWWGSCLANVLGQLNKKEDEEKGVSQVLVLGENVQLPDKVYSLLKKGPKFSLEPAVPPHELLAFNRRVASRAPQDQHDRCLLEGIDALARTVKAKKDFLWIAANEHRADDATRMPGLRPQLLIGQGRSIPAPTHEPAGPVESCGHSTTSPHGPYYRGKPPWDQPEVPRSLQGRDVPEPFRGLTLEDRHPNEPGASYTEEERRLLCALCGVPEIHRSTHRASPLHAERAAAERARQHVPNDEEAVTQALLVLRSLRPDLLARPQAIREDDILDIEINDV